ncbi:hypothetical protein BSKO_14047 [Bryopsis sp. KO-2023]|nr:hypothetical protein BSKO_14047 [Bryopsis sp. KO-2023]
MFQLAPPAATGRPMFLRSPTRVPLATALRKPNPFLAPPANGARFAVVPNATTTEVTYASQFRDLSAEEIDQEVEKCKIALYELRVARASGKEIKTHEFRWNRKKVAQLLTVRREKEIEQGINSRKSRKMEIKRLLEAGEMV